MKRGADRLAALAVAGVVFGLAAADGHALELVWLPAVVLGAVWPYEWNGRLRGCLRALRRRSEERA